MTCEELRGVLRSRRVRLEAREGRLRVVGRREALTPEVEASIQEHSAELLMQVTGRLVTCKDLYRYVRRGDRVGTPSGDATVLQVFADRLTVVYDGAERAAFSRPEEVRFPIE